MPSFGGVGKALAKEMNVEPEPEPEPEPESEEDREYRTRSRLIVAFTLSSLLT